MLTFKNRSARHALCIPSPCPDRIFQVASEKVPLPSGQEGAGGGLVPPVPPATLSVSRQPAGGGARRRFPRARWARGRTAIASLAWWGRGDGVTVEAHQLLLGEGMCFYYGRGRHGAHVGFRGYVGG